MYRSICFLRKKNVNVEEWMARGMCMVSHYIVTAVHQIIDTHWINGGK